MRKISKFLCGAFLSISAPGFSSPIAKVYLDQQNNIHYLSAEGTDIKISAAGNASAVKLSPDHHIIAWLVKETDRTDEGVELSPSKLAIYRANRLRFLKCQPFIRDYWFWKNGAQIAIDCGGEHFAGREILYDTASLTILESFEQAAIPLEQRPDWSNGDN